MEWKLEVVTLHVSDIERAKQFYSEQAGFIIDHDTQISEGMRIVQLTPPGSACSIVFGNGLGESSSATSLQLVVSDIEAARSALVERGMEVSAITHFENGAQVEGRGEDWNSFIFFSDPDGNQWTVQERPTRDQ